jgi:hypothetical protein
MVTTQRAGAKQCSCQPPQGQEYFLSPEIATSAGEATHTPIQRDSRGCGARLSGYLYLMPRLRKTVAMYLHATKCLHGTHRHYLPFGYESTLSFLVCKWSLSQKFYKHIYMYIASYARAYDPNSTNYGIHSQS